MRKNAEPMFQSKMIQILDNILVLGDMSCQCQKITLDTLIKWKVCRGCIVSVIIGKEEITQDSDTLMELKERLRKQGIFQGFRQFYKKLSVLFEDEAIKIQAIQSRFDEFIYVAKIINKVKCTRMRALNEVQILLKMDHKNIVRLYEVYEGKSSFYLIMEKLQRPLDIDLEYDHNEIRLILQQILLGLLHLHRNNIVHRDIKPSNIMFDDENNIRIIDFGLASSTLNYAGDQICGTPGYIAPEIMQMNERQHLQFPEKCDLFSVGVLMYEMYAQENLFKGFSSEEIFQHNASFKVCEMPPIPDNGQDLLRGLLQPDPFYRFTSQQALAHSYFELADESSNKVIPMMEPRLHQHQEVMSQNCKKMTKEIPTMITMQTTKGQSQMRRGDDTSN